MALDVGSTEANEPEIKRESPQRHFGEAEVRNHYIALAKSKSSGRGRINPMLLGSNGDFDGDPLNGQLTVSPNYLMMFGKLADRKSVV